MPKITEVQNDRVIEFLSTQISSGFEGHPSKLYGWSGGERSPGLHLSDILQDLYIRLEKNRQGGMEAEAIWSMGLAWEHLLSWAWRRVFPDQPDRIVHMGEFTKDGILMTPDRIDVVEQHVVEMKCTWKSARKWPISECWYYLVQGKAYCHALGMTKCRYYILHIMDVLGMYGGSPVPPKCWDVEFTERELELNWSMITAHRDLMLKEMGNGMGRK